jgi:hypothetical protein
MEMVRRNVPYGDAYILLSTIYLERGQLNEAAGVYRSVSGNPRLTQSERESLQTILRRLEQGL